MSNNQNIVNILGAAVIFVGVIGLALLFLVPLTLLNAFVFIKLWGWFIVPFLSPYISHVPIPSYPVAIGVSLLACMLQYRPQNNSDKKPWSVIGNSIFHSLMTLFVGWVVSLFM